MSPSPLDHPPLTPIAGNGLLDRRHFLTRSFQSVAALSGVLGATRADAATPHEPWMHAPGAPFSNYGHPSNHEAHLIRWISAASDLPQNGISWTPLQDLDGIITPSGLHFERHHNGVPQIDPKQHALIVHGACKQPLKFDRASLLRYPRHSQILFIECGGNSNAGWNPKPIQTPVGYFHGLVSCSEWTGVPLRILLDEAEIDPNAQWLIAEGADAFGMTISLPLAKARLDCMIGLFQNGEPLRPEQGYPMRLIVPGWEGVTHVKWLRTLQIATAPVMARNETSRYTELQPNGKARMFTWIMDAKSLITSPAVGMRLPGPGFYEISGLAWTGRGKVAKVEVSADAGKTWADAELNAPVLPRAFTRFRSPWQWDGKPAVVQSRVTDETGYLQPTRAALLAERGQQGYFHYNAIVSWQVQPDGAVRHIYIGDTAATPHGAADPFDAPWQ